MGSNPASRARNCWVFSDSDRERRTVRRDPQTNPHQGGAEFPEVEDGVAFDHLCDVGSVRGAIDDVSRRHVTHE